MPQPDRPSRRRVVAGLVLAPVTAALASCTLAPTPRATAIGDVPDADARRRWNAIRIERDLIALVTATAAAHPDLSDPLAGYADHHRRHVETLRAEGPLPRLADDADDVPAPEVSASVADAVAAIAAAERAAVDAHLAGCGSCQGPRLAGVLASTGASDAGIAALVEAL